MACASGSEQCTQSVWVNQRQLTVHQNGRPALWITFSIVIKPGMSQPDGLAVINHLPVLDVSQEGQWQRSTM